MSAANNAYEATKKRNDDADKKPKYRKKYASLLITTTAVKDFDDQGNFTLQEIVPGLKK